MPRNDLIIKLSEEDNDCVTVDVDGILIDVDSVARDRGNIVLVLDPDELQATLRQRSGGEASGGGGSFRRGDEFGGARESE
ncbi:hypothetical protein [Couchioplanes azureus]|uniref:hypothetical protein n=1 Tax=Couchioplanes caeruleus TaxID=56438 RepID=UPI0016708FC1|nr:hypothetical protein [Couchioplanes caeruleus]GGQ42572.1 hypothetical protein GCM10010166_08330 [Couchioplanes caeruleus subsp. azureus]